MYVIGLKVSVKFVESRNQAFFVIHKMRFSVFVIDGLSYQKKKRS